MACLRFYLLQNPLCGLLSEPETVLHGRPFRLVRTDAARAACRLVAAPGQKDFNDGILLHISSAAAEETA